MTLQDRCGCISCARTVHRTKIIISRSGEDGKKKTIPRERAAGVWCRGQVSARICNVYIYNIIDRKLSGRMPLPERIIYIVYIRTVYKIHSNPQPTSVCGEYIIMRVRFVYIYIYINKSAFINPFPQRETGAKKCARLVLCLIYATCSAVHVACVHTYTFSLLYIYVCVGGTCNAPKRAFPIQTARERSVAPHFSSEAVRVPVYKYIIILYYINVAFTIAHECLFNDDGGLVRFPRSRGSPSGHRTGFPCESQYK